MSKKKKQKPVREKLKGDVTLDPALSTTAEVGETFLRSTPDRKPNRVRKITPGWKCCSIWLPTEVVDLLAAEAARVQYKPEPNLSLYLRDLLIKKAEGLQRKGN